MNPNAGDEEEMPIAWTAIRQHEEVVTSDGEMVGTVSEVMGTGNVGIFHGLAVQTHLVHYPVSVPATNVASITNREVTLNIDQAQFRELEPFVPEESFKLGIKGLFFHRLGWTEDHDRNG
ncbi:MAG TPA: DUF2171 domain-containing protein [Chloroflexota bacterium]|nr:DUF2171 domain-containing protein [Chloroflexota bacterium]